MRVGAVAWLARALLLASMLGGCAHDDTSGDAAPPPECARNELRSPYFGDTHSHTKYSLDAGTQRTTLGPHALRLAAPSWVVRVPAYAIGALAAYWCIERTALIIGALGVLGV